MTGLACLRLQHEAYLQQLLLFLTNDAQMDCSCKLNIHTLIYGVCVFVTSRNVSLSEVPGPQVVFIMLAICLRDLLIVCIDFNLHVQLVEMRCIFVVFQCI